MLSAHLGEVVLLGSLEGEREREREREREIHICMHCSSYTCMISIPCGVLDGYMEEVMVWEGETVTGTK